MFELVPFSQSGAANLTWLTTLETHSHTNNTHTIPLPILLLLLLLLLPHIQYDHQAATGFTSRHLVCALYRTILLCTYNIALSHQREREHKREARTWHSLCSVVNSSLELELSCSSEGADCSSRVESSRVWSGRVGLSSVELSSVHTHTHGGSLWMDDDEYVSLVVAGIYVGQELS